MLPGLPPASLAGLGRPWSQGQGAVQRLGPQIGHLCTHASSPSSPTDPLPFNGFHFSPNPGHYLWPFPPSTLFSGHSPSFLYPSFPSGEHTQSLPTHMALLSSSACLPNASVWELQYHLRLIICKMRTHLPPKPTISSADGTSESPPFLYVILDSGCFPLPSLAPSLTLGSPQVPP